MKILIAADMEGISGVTNWDQVDPARSEYPRFCKIMTADVNAAALGTFDGGATEVVVSDGHAGGYNILIEDLDPRVCLNSGNSAPFAMVQGIEAGDFSGVIFVGYHARSGTEKAVLAHTWSSKRIANVWLNDILVGEHGLNAAVCGAFGAPVLMITGDQTTCAQAEELLGGLETVIVKHSTSFSSAECLHPYVAQELIRKDAERAVSGLKDGKPKPFTVSEPVKTIIEFRLSEMVDRACRLPGAKRLDATRIEMTAPDMPTAYINFRAVVQAA
ncbi:MAG: M55 family metallopeptidase [Anaerolineales bacterium]|nr:M55 family metallopeptidase [Chloroflexota bacterium]MBL6980839.1 M55 family metallopeptidase [Anaerolineales bacterium]